MTRRRERQREGQTEGEADRQTDREKRRENSVGVVCHCLSNYSIPLLYLTTTTTTIIITIITRLLSNLRHDHPRMRAFSYFRSRNKNDRHSMRSAAARNPILRSHFDALCYRRRVIGDRISHCGDADLCWHAGFGCENTGWLSIFFCSCDLDLDPMTFRIRT